MLCRCCECWDNMNADFVNLTLDLQTPRREVEMVIRILSRSRESGGRRPVKNNILVS